MNRQGVHHGTTSDTTSRHAVCTSLAVSSHRRWRPCQTSSRWSWVPGVRAAAFPMFAVKQATLLDILECTNSSLQRCNVVGAIWNGTARCIHEETEDHTLAGGVRSCQEGWARATANRHMKRRTRPEGDEQATCTSLIA